MPVNAKEGRDASREGQLLMLFAQNLALKFCIAKGMLGSRLCVATTKVLLRMFQNSFVSGSLVKILILMRIAV